MRLATLLLVLVACSDPPPFTLKFSITGGDVQACTSSTGTKATTCSEVTMLCNAVVSIRIFSPSDPSAPYISECKPLITSPTKRDLCAIAGVDLIPPASPVKAQTLEVDMTVYAQDKLATDDMGNYICPADVAFGADGFPVAATTPCDDPDPAICPPQPAVGGRAFYHTGDTETVVSLGCTNLEQLEDRSCAGQSSLVVTASVNDFDTALSVSPATADALLVSIGEPTSNSVLMEYQLQSSQLHALDRASEGPVPSWQGDFDVKLMNAACLDVLEDGTATTAALTCTNNIAANPLDLPGIRLSSATLDQILKALGMAQLPDSGLVVGIVLDYLGRPQAGVPIVPAPAGSHISYLSSDRKSFGGTMTTDSGIWVSQDAKFPTTFTPGGIMAIEQPGFGGLVYQKVDVVVIQFKPPGTGG
jgi:hypothetical protein